MSVGERVALALVGILVAACDPGSGGAAPSGFATGRLPRLEGGGELPVVLSWVEGDTTSARLMYAEIGDRGAVTARQAASGSGWVLNWADVPGVTPLAGGTLAAHWYTAGAGGGHNYDLRLAWSDDAGTGWTAAGSPHPGGLPGEHGFASAFAGGAAGVAWLDGRDVASGGATALRTASRDNATDTVIDDRVCDCCQTDFASTGDGGVLVYRDRDGDEIRDISLLRMEGGHWLGPITVAADGWRVSGCPVNGPAVAAAGQRVAVVWPTAAGGRMRVRAAWSVNGGRSFAAPVEIDSDHPVGRVDVALTDDGDALVIWLARPNAGRTELKLVRLGADGVRGVVTVVADLAEGRFAGFPQLAQAAGAAWVAWNGDEGPRLARLDAGRL